MLSKRVPNWLSSAARAAYLQFQNYKIASGNRASLIWLILKTRLKVQNVVPPYNSFPSTWTRAKKSPVPEEVALG